jgi:hypothetical protein
LPRRTYWPRRNKQALPESDLSQQVDAVNKIGGGTDGIDDYEDENDSMSAKDDDGRSVSAKDEYGSEAKSIKRSKIVKAHRMQWRTTLNESDGVTKEGGQRLHDTVNKRNKEVQVRQLRLITTINLSVAMMNNNDSGLVPKDETLKRINLTFWPRQFSRCRNKLRKWRVG